MTYDKIYALDDLEVLMRTVSLADISTLVGLQVALPVDEGEFEIVRTARVGQYQIGLEMTQRCVCCGVTSHPFYLCKGRYGWRDLRTKDGAFVADLYETGYLCGDCLAAVRQRVLVILLPPFALEDLGDKTLHRPPAGLNLERLN